MEAEQNVPIDEQPDGQEAAPASEPEPVEQPEQPAEELEPAPVEAVAEAAVEVPAEAEAVAPQGYDESSPRKWFIIHTYSGFEKKVKESLESRVVAFGLQDKIGRMMIPTEDVLEVRGGKKVVSTRMLYPGYVLVEMDMDDYTWHVVRNTPRVTGFVGSGETPTPLSETEVENILHRVTTSADRPKPKLVFERNEQVRIVEGPFANFTGVVDDVNTDRNTLKVSVTIFGRSTPVELDFVQVEKMA